MKNATKFTAIGISIAVVVIILTFCSRDRIEPLGKDISKSSNVITQNSVKRSVTIDFQRDAFRKLMKDTMKEIEKEARKKAKKKKHEKVLKNGGILDSIIWPEIEAEIYSMTDAEAYHFMYPLLQPSIDLTDSLFGIDLTDDFASNDYSIVLSGVTAEQTYLLAKNEIMQDTTITSIIEPESYPTGTPEDLEKILNCLAESIIGFPITTASIGGLTYVAAAKKTVRRAIRKYCLTFLGPAATAVALWDFGKCMGWWGNIQNNIL